MRRQRRQCQQSRTNSQRLKWGCWTEDGGSTTYFRKNPLRALTSTCLPFSHICVTGESNVSFYVAIWPVGVLPFSHIIFNSFVQFFVLKKLSLSLFALTFLGNLKTLLSCCWRRFMTTWVCPWNNPKYKSISFFFLFFLFWTNVAKISRRWENEGQLTKPSQKTFSLDFTWLFQ